MTYEDASQLKKGDFVYEVTAPGKGRAVVRGWKVLDATPSRLMLAQPETARLVPVHRKNMQRFEGTPQAAAATALLRARSVVVEYRIKLKAAEQAVLDRERLLEIFP